MKRVFALLALALTASGMMAQESFPQYPSPLDIPVYLSATFASGCRHTVMVTWSMSPITTAIPRCMPTSKASTRPSPNM